jgi:hypothetical protein
MASSSEGICYMDFSVLMLPIVKRCRLGYSLNCSSGSFSYL